MITRSITDRQEASTILSILDPPPTDGTARPRVKQALLEDPLRDHSVFLLAESHATPIGAALITQRPAGNGRERIIRYVLAPGSGDEVLNTLIAEADDWLVSRDLNGQFVFVNEQDVNRQSQLARSGFERIETFTVNRVGVIDKKPPLPDGVTLADAMAEARIAAHAASRDASAA